jgi:hypothetical protein
MRGATLAVLAATAALSGGCMQVQPYLGKTDLPWPDEWSSGSSIPFDRAVLLSAHTVRRHRKAQMVQRPRKIRSAVTRRLDLYCFAREMRASSEPRGRPLPYLEVKIAARFFGPLKIESRSTIEYDGAEFGEVIGRLAGHVGRGFLLSPSVGLVVSVTAVLADVDLREVLVRILLDRNLFIDPIWHNPVTLRSYDYSSQEMFLDAVGHVTAILANPDPHAPLSEVSLADWAASNAGHQLQFRTELEQTRSAGRLGPLPGTGLLSTGLEVVKKQVLYALAAQLRQER